MRFAASSLLAGALALAVAAPASAATIGFEGVAPPGGSVVPVLPYVEAGFTLTSSAPQNGIFDAASGVNSNGTDIFGWCASDCGGTQVITVVGPPAFSITSIDVGYLSAFGPGMSVNLEGFFSGGGSIVANLPVERTWSTYALAGFTGLSSLRITAVDPTPGSPLLDSAIDNLVVDAVPEPASLLLLAAGLLGAGSVRRRRS